MRRKRFPIWRVPGGVTLLELLLALALSVVVLTAIGMAINLHFKMLDARRTNIEEIQAIRVIAQRMMNDIRANVQQYKPDTSGLETTFANAMQAATSQASAAAAGAATIISGSGASGGQGGSGGGAQTGGGGQGAGGGQQGGQGQGAQSQGTGGQGTGASGQSGGGQSGQAAGGAQAGGGQAGGTAAAGGGGASGASGAQSGSGSSTEAASAETTAAPAVKLVGSAMELRFDISRLPRVDQYQGILSKGEFSAVDLPSDVKTIVYFIRSDTSAATYAANPQAPGGEPSLDGYGRGLMRAELDRAVSSYAETGGGTEAVYANAQLLSEEVVGLGFEYFDGVDWLTEWDSSSQGLPRAIRIWLSVKPTYGMSDQELSEAAAGKAPVETDLYFTVSLPTTPLVIPAAETETTEAASGSSSTSSTGATGASSAGTFSGTATQGATP